MKTRSWRLLAGVLAGMLYSEAALACHVCKQNPCVLAPAAPPALQCVTEMVPFTVLKTRTKVDLVSVCTKTVMKTKLETVYDEQTHEVCKPVYDTVYQTRCVTVCRPVCETSMVCQSIRVCRQVTTTRQVTDWCLRPFTELVTVPVKTKCSRCGHAGGGCTCQTVARTCSRRVPVIHEVAETRMVSEIQTQRVPVVRWRMVPEEKLETVPVTTCRMVSEVVRVRVPRLIVTCEPETQVYKQAVLSCEEVPVTVYRPVVKMVPVVQASSQVAPTAQAQQIAPVLSVPTDSLRSRETTKAGDREKPGKP